MVNIMEKDKVQKTVTLLAEIIYDLYEELQKGNIDMSKVEKQAVGKSAPKSQTFHQSALKFGS
jgi:hypothetical protein